jgi:hypothetical protein
MLLLYNIGVLWCGCTTTPQCYNVTHVHRNRGYICRNDGCSIFIGGDGGWEVGAQQRRRRGRP